MSESYGRLQSLFHPPVSRVIQQYNISQLNTGGRGRGGRMSGRGYEGIGYGCGCGYGCGSQGGIVGSKYGHNPYDSPAGA